MVLEVDHTTDVRRGKLKLYEAWGFPELWVEVPERRAPSRPKSRMPGLVIHLLEDGAYRQSSESVTFPGWRAEDIHEALNEVGRSVRTNAIVERMGRRLGVREGTGPDDDSLMRSCGSESAQGLAEGHTKGLAEGRVEGHAKGLAEGRLAGLTKGRAEMVRQILRSRGIEDSEGFPENALAFAGVSEAALVAAALACDSGLPRTCRPPPRLLIFPTHRSEHLAAKIDGNRSVTAAARECGQPPRELHRQIVLLEARADVEVGGHFGWRDGRTHRGAKRFEPPMLL